MLAVLEEFIKVVLLIKSLEIIKKCFEFLFVAYLN